VWTTTLAKVLPGDLFQILIRDPWNDRTQHAHFDKKRLLVCVWNHAYDGEDDEVGSRRGRWVGYVTKCKVHFDFLKKDVLVHVHNRQPDMLLLKDLL
jgi:hypothetical protein